MQQAALLLSSLLLATAAAAEPADQVTAPPAPPEGVGLGYQFEASIATTYVFRGVPQYGRLSDPSSQNTAALRLDRLGPGALTLTLWNATSVANFQQNSTTALEFDLSASYGMDLGAGFSASVGYTAYLYPEHAANLPYDGAHEIQLGVSWANEWVTPSLLVALEVARLRGAYASLGLSRDLNAGPLVITPAFSLGIAGYNDYLLSGHPADPHLNDLSASVGVKLPFSDVFYAALRFNGAYRATPESVSGSIDRFSGLVAFAIGAAR
ncbi:MAG: TorF family putative porin [Myxococcota bacterium]